LPSRTPLEATWGPPKTPLLLLLPEEVRRRNGRLLAATTTGIIVSGDDAPAIIISIKGVLLILQRCALRARASFDFSLRGGCGFFFCLLFCARALVCGWRVTASIDCLKSLSVFSAFSVLLSLSLSLSLGVFLSLSLLACSAARLGETTTKKKLAHLFSNFILDAVRIESKKKRGKRVVSAKRETLEKLLWRRIKIAKGYDGTREIVRIMSREVSSRARRCTFFF